MVIKYCSSNNYGSQRRDDIHFPQFESGGSDLPSQSCQVILVRVCDFLDQAMFSQSLEQPRDLMSTLAGQVSTKITILKSADVKLTSNDGTEKIKIIAGKKIEPAITAVVIFYWSGDFVQVPDATAWIINRRDEVEVPAIGISHHFKQDWQTVDRFPKWGNFHLPRAVAMFHPSVVFEKRNVISYSLDTKNKAEFVIHLYGDFAHMMPDTRSLNSGMKVIAHLVDVIAIEFTSKKRSDILRFDRVNSGTHNLIIYWLKIALSLKDNVCSIFDLHDTPMITVGKVANNRTVLPDDFVKLSMMAFDVYIIGQFLSLAKVVNPYKAVVEQLKTNTFFIKLGCQLVMAVAVELQTERHPCWHPQITQSQFRRNEVEVIMQTPAGNRFEIGFVCFLVMPWLITSTRFHRREYIHQSGMRTSLFYNLLDTLFFAEFLFAEKFDFQTIFLCQTFSICANLISQRLSPFSVIEYTNVFCSEQTAHPISITDSGDNSCKYDSVKARECTLNLVCVTNDKIFHNWQYLQKLTNSRTNSAIYS
jgi:hypothetical protein